MVTRFEWHSTINRQLSEFRVNRTDARTERQKIGTRGGTVSTPRREGARPRDSLRTRPRAGTHGGGHVDGAIQHVLFADVGERAGLQLNAAAVFHHVFGDVAHVEQGCRAKEAVLTSMAAGAQAVRGRWATTYRRPPPDGLAACA